MIEPIGFVSTASEVQAFLDGPVWRDMSAMLEQKLELLRGSVDTLMGVEDLRLIQGQIAEVKELTDLPHILLDELQLNERQKQEE